MTTAVASREKQRKVAKAKFLASEPVWLVPVRRLALELASGFAPGSTADNRIDEAAGVIRKVKIVGVKSRNPAKVLGLERSEFGPAVDESYSYDPKGLKAAIPLYEGAAVYDNHPNFKYTENGQRVVESTTRPNKDLLGWVRNVFAVETGDPEVDGLYGDFHYIKSHALSPSIIEVARRAPDKFKFSHEAQFDDPRVRNGKIVLGSIRDVYGIALVNSDAGTTGSLFESLAKGISTMTKKLLKTAIEEMPKTQPGRHACMELMGAGYGAEEPMPDVGGAEPLSPDDQIKAAFRAAIVAICDDPDLEIKDMMGRIKDILTAESKLIGDGSPVEEEPPAEDKPAEGATAEDDMEGEGEEEGSAESTTAESGATPVPKNTVVEDRAKVILECTDMLVAEGAPVKKSILEAMAALPPDSRKNFAAEWAAQGKAAAAPAPRSSAQNKPAPPAKTEEYKHGDLAASFKR